MLRNLVILWKAWGPIILALIGCFVSFPGTADSRLQLPPEDSLLQIFEDFAEEAPERVDILNKLSNLYVRNEIQKAKNYASQAMILASYLDYPKGIAEAYFNLAYIARKKHEYENAIDNLYDGLDYIQDQEEHLGLKARIVREIANVYGQTENYAQADTFYAEAQELSRLVGNQKDIIFILHNRGLMNLRQGQVDTANIFAREALELAKTYQQQDGIGYAYRLLGEVYGIGYVQPREALGYLNQAYEIFLANDDQQSLTEVYFEMGRNYTALAQFTKADSLLNLAKDNAEKLDNPYSLLEVYRIYRDLEEARLNYQVSLQYYKLSEVLRDSLRGYNQYWQIAKQQTDLKTKELGQEIAEFEGRTRLQKSILILVSVFAFGLAVLLGVIYRINRQRNLTNAKLREQNDEIEAYNVELSQKNEEIAAQADWLRDSNDQIKKQTDELSKLNRMKDRMLSVISHDFRSPLNSLRGALMLLNSQQLPPDQLQMVTDDINNKLNRTLNLVDNLLQWTRNQLMGVEVNRQQLNMHDLGDETFNLLQPLAEGKRITLVNHIAEDTTIDADLEMMKVVLRNLVSNAIKFTLKGGEVRVESKIEDHYLSISVIDTGIGMTPDKVDRLFELGTDRSSLGTANEKGTGIGLLLCKEFIEKHGGHIHVISIEEKGSTFTFSLPLRAASRSQMELETVS